MFKQQSSIPELPVLIEEVKELESVTLPFRTLEEVREYSRAYVRSQPNPNGGFNQVYPVNRLLTDFMDLEAGTRVSRADAQRAICTYIKNNDLSDPERKSRINLDHTLETLLQWSDGQITYPEIVRQMQWLFPDREEAARIRAERNA
jgi:hypothetical protein